MEIYSFELFRQCLIYEYLITISCLPANIIEIYDILLIKQILFILTFIHYLYAFYIFKFNSKIVCFIIKR